VSFGFGCISNNIAGDCDIGEAQLAVDVTAGPASDQVSFTFTNTGSADSSIADVYFDDGTLLGIASILDGTGVDFEEGASPPNLPGGNDVGFDATFAADSEPPAQPNGVNPGEELTIIFDLLTGEDLASTLAALIDGSLRIGIHVQGFETGGSESFVSVPEPGLAWLLAGPILVLAARARSRKR
jgi:hypothetical protein